ncbi:MAG: hypothetical protein HY787_09035 [Deltaproteobacteria bacterium]|nr:hypothetical protein [Deltaproteobacteria bacterium]
MDSFAIFKVSASALEAQRGRMNTIASNMANIHSTQTESGGPYKRKDVVFSTLPIDSNKSPALEGVKLVQVVESQDPFKRIYDPCHPDADKDGERIHDYLPLIAFLYIISFLDNSLTQMTRKRPFRNWLEEGISPVP